MCQTIDTYTKKIETIDVHNKCGLPFFVSNSSGCTDYYCQYCKEEIYSFEIDKIDIKLVPNIYSLFNKEKELYIEKIEKDNIIYNSFQSQSLYFQSIFLVEKYIEKHNLNKNDFEIKEYTLYSDGVYYSTVIVKRECNEKDCYDAFWSTSDTLFIKQNAPYVRTN